MNSRNRGIECALDYYKLQELLREISQKKWDFCIPWCLKDGLYPIRNAVVSGKDLVQMFDWRIWELELHCHKCGEDYTEIKSYQDFLTSSCECLLLYYDCGNLEIYIKNQNDFEWLYEFLRLNGATELSIKTNECDMRTKLFL